MGRVSIRACKLYVYMAISCNGARCGGDLDLTGPIPASCPKWPGHKLSWKKQDWETSGNASFFKPSHKKKYHSDYLLSIIVIIITIIIILIDFPKQNPLFWETMILQIKDFFFTNSPSGCLWLRWTDFGATRVLVFIGSAADFGGWRPAFSRPIRKGRHRSFLKSKCFFVDTQFGNLKQILFFCVVDAIFCENKSLVPSCLVSSTFGCPQYPQTTWRFD